MYYKIVFVDVVTGNEYTYADNANISYFTIRSWRRLLVALQQHNDIYGDDIKIIFYPISKEIF